MGVNPCHQSLSQLSRLTGKAQATIRKRLIGLDPVHREGQAIIYDSRQALKLIYDPKSTVGEAINYETEKARAEKNKADKLEMQNAVTRGELVERSEVLADLQKSFAAVRAKLLAIPTKAAPVIITLGDASLAQSTLKKFVHDALDELTYPGIDETDRKG